MAVLNLSLFIITGNILTLTTVYNGISSLIVNKDLNELNTEALKNIKKAIFNKNTLFRFEISGDNRYFPY